MKKILYHIFLLLCIAVFCISAYKLYGYYKSYKEAKDTYEKIKKDNIRLKIFPYCLYIFLYLLLRSNKVLGYHPMQSIEEG